MKVSSLFAILTALVAWFALGLQLVLMIERLSAEGHTALFALWRFLGFFTILTNLFVAVVSTAILMRPAGSLAGARTRMAAVVAIILVGLVYSLALRSIWNPTGWQAVADHLLHDATPVLFTLTWLFSGHGSLAWRDTFLAMTVPVAYFVYAMARGTQDGWYAYWFLNPANLTALEMTRNVFFLLLAFWSCAILIVWLDKFLGTRPGRIAT